MNSPSGETSDATSANSLIEMARAYSRSRVLCATARLGIADALFRGAHTVAELAKACGAEAGSLYRLLRALASIGVTAETEPGVFVLTPFGDPLRKDAPHSAWPAVVFWADLISDSWVYLTDCVRTGSTAFSVMESRGIASGWSKDPDAGAIFRAVMGTGPAEDCMSIVRSWDFGSRGVVADLGGGGGDLLIAILKSHSNLSGMLVERQLAIDAATPRFEAERLTDRCKLIGADIGEKVPEGADVYIMKHVLHGYKDVAAINILKNCRAAIPSHGCLLVMEFVLPDVVSHADPRLESRLMSDLNMMAVTGGKERSAPEWTKLLRSAGFEMQRIIPVEAGGWLVQDVSIIEASPVSNFGV